MTYKAIVKEMIRMSATEWIGKLLAENGIKYHYTVSDVTEMENDKKTDTIYWNVRIEIHDERWSYKEVNVGGTADDMVGICNSCIWDADKKNIIWMSVESTREDLGIKEFKVA